MMRIVNGKFAHHIMNTHRRLPKHLQDVGIFSAIRIQNEKCTSRPIGNKESKIQPIEEKDKNCLECGMLCFKGTLPFTIHIHPGNGNFEWLW
jgi:hypothetical protein